MLLNNKSKSNTKFISTLLILLIIILLPFLLLKNSLFVITTPSMEPTLNIGDLVILGEKSPEEINIGEKEGDILILKGPQYFYEKGFNPIFWNNLNNNTPIIHRAIDKKKIGENWYFLTKGDNNLLYDGSLKLLNYSEDYILIEYNSSKLIYISETEILGVVIFKIPFIGYLNIFFPIVLILLIIFIIFYLIFKKLNYKVNIVKISKTPLEKKLNLKIISFYNSIIKVLIKW